MFYSSDWPRQNLIVFQMKMNASLNFYDFMVVVSLR